MPDLATPKQVVLATENIGKVAEMQSTLKEFGFNVLPQTNFDFPEAIEDGLSFVENAIKKARHACEHTGLAAIADDSGLEVDALNGAPGIYSARYADGQGDKANNTKLLNALANHELRAARFRCVLVMMRHTSDPTPIICTGTWEGEISKVAKGENGFGYDPIFFCPKHNCHAAELDPKTKQTVSHRALALKQLQQLLTL